MELSDIKKIACLGGGVIGSSWTLQFAMHGLNVALRDINDEMLEKSKNQINQYLASLENAGVVSKAAKEDIWSRISLTTSVEEAVTEAQFIQENGPERLNIKQSILADAEKYASADAIYASSTSGLLISDICEKAAHPERCIGAHPYNPPHLIPLVELTQHDKSTPESVHLAYAFYQSIGKEAVLLQKECPGFISNRLQMAVYREMIDLVNRGVCSVEDADKALVFGPGLRWALFGHSMILQMANPNGLSGFFEMLGTGADAWLKDMADWKKMPSDMSAFQEGVNKEMEAFPDFKGHDSKSCAAFRDKGLIELLKLHQKL